MQLIVPVVAVPVAMPQACGLVSAAEVEYQALTEATPEPASAAVKPTGTDVPLVTVGVTEAAEVGAVRSMA